MSAASDVSEEIDFGRSAKEALYAMIAQDKDPKIIRIQAQLVQSFRDEITSNSAETPIEYAEQTLLRLIKERKDPKDIKLQAQIVRDLEKLISSQIPPIVNKENAKRDGQGKRNIEKRQADGQQKTRNADTKAAKYGKRAHSPITEASNTSPLASLIRCDRRHPSAPRQRSESPVRVAPTRRHSPPSPTEYLSDASSYRSPPKSRPCLGPPRRTIQVRKFDSKEDKWSRQIMHPASEPRAQLPKLIRAGNDLEKIQQVSTVHASYDTGITKTTQKHRRKINRTNGTRAPDLGVKRDVWAMLGARPDGSRLQPRENEGERVEETGLTAGNLRRLTEAMSGEENRTFADVVEEQLEMEDAHATDEQSGMDWLARY